MFHVEFDSAVCRDLLLWKWCSRGYVACLPLRQQPLERAEPAARPIAFNKSSTNPLCRTRRAPLDVRRESVGGTQTHLTYCWLYHDELNLKRKIKNQTLNIPPFNTCTPDWENVHAFCACVQLFLHKFQILKQFNFLDASLNFLDSCHAVNRKVVVAGFPSCNFLYNYVIYPTPDTGLKTRGAFHPRAHHHHHHHRQQFISSFRNMTTDWLIVLLTVK